MAVKRTKTKSETKPVVVKRKTRVKTSDEHVARAIDHAIDKLHEKLSSASAKPSVADLVRLLQLKKELDGDRPKDVTVRWVDECKDNSLSVA